MKESITITIERHGDRWIAWDEDGKQLNLPVVSAVFEKTTSDYLYRRVYAAMRVILRGDREDSDS